MSAETQKVDVLAVMRAAVGRLRVQHPDNDADQANDASARSLHESIDAVAELIEAVKAIRDARDHSAENGEYPEGLLAEGQEFDDWAADVASAALARVGGSA